MTVNNKINYQSIKSRTVKIRGRSTKLPFRTPDTTPLVVQCRLRTNRHANVRGHAEMLTHLQRVNSSCVKWTE